jgi:hypothetical protein
MSISFSGSTLTFSDSTTMTTAAVAGPPGPTGPAGSPSSVAGPPGPTGSTGPSGPPGLITLISTKTCSNPTWTGLSGYNNYLLIFYGSNGAVAQVGYGATPTYKTCGYAMSYNASYFYNGSSGGGGGGSFNTPGFFLSNGSSFCGAYGTQEGHGYLYGFTDGGRVTWSYSGGSQQGGPTNNIAAGYSGGGNVNSSGNAMTAISVKGYYFSACFNGKISLYGINT